MTDNHIIYLASYYYPDKLNSLWDTTWYILIRASLFANCSTGDLTGWLCHYNLFYLTQNAYFFNLKLPYPSPAPYLNFYIKSLNLRSKYASCGAQPRDYGSSHNWRYTNCVHTLPPGPPPPGFAVSTVHPSTLSKSV